LALKGRNTIPFKGSLATFWEGSFGRDWFNLGGLERGIKGETILFGVAHCLG